MSVALITGIALGIVGIAYSTVLGFTTEHTADILRHTSIGIFSTLITLLGHSMTMFYLIGKGKAVREAAREGGLSPEFHRAVARARRPVFSMATVAMVLVMGTAIFGGGVDTDFIPAGVHSLLAVSALVANLMALRTELVAMISIARTVAEVDQLLDEQATTNEV